MSRAIPAIGPLRIPSPSSHHRRHSRRGQTRHDVFPPLALMQSDRDTARMSSSGEGMNHFRFSSGRSKGRGDRFVLMTEVRYRAG